MCHCVSSRRHPASVLRQQVLPARARPRQARRGLRVSPERRLRVRHSAPAKAPVKVTASRAPELRRDSGPQPPVLLGPEALLGPAEPLRAFRHVLAADPEDRDRRP